MTQPTTTNPFVNLILTEEENQLEQALEAGEFEETPDFAETKSMLESAAAQYLELNKSKPITIRINQLDLIKVKAKAKRSNVPYQTLLGFLVHQYAESNKTLKLS